MGWHTANGRTENGIIVNGSDVNSGDGKRTTLSEKLKKKFKKWFNKLKAFFTQKPFWTKKRKTIALFIAFITVAVIFGVVVLFLAALSICLALAFRV